MRSTALKLAHMLIDVGINRRVQAQDVLVEPAARAVAICLEQRQLGALGAAALRAAADARLGARADDARDEAHHLAVAHLVRG